MHPFIGHKIVSRITEVAGLSVKLSNKGEATYALVIMQRRRNKLILAERIENLTSVADIREALPKGCPVLVNIDGWGVLVKKSKITEGQSVDNSHLGDSAEFSAHYYYPPDCLYAFMAVVRNDLLQQTLAPLQQVGLEMITVDVGPFEACHFLTLLQLNGNFSVGGRTIKIEDGKVADIVLAQQVQPEPVLIGEDNVPVGLVAAYSMVAHFFITNDVSAFEGNDALLSNYLYKKAGQLLGWGALVVLLAALLVNFVFFSQYNTQLNQLAAEFESRQVIFDKLELMSKDIKLKEELIQGGDMTGQTTFAYYADRLALCLPPQITLTQMAFQLPKRKLANGREAQFALNEILINGETTNSQYISRWMEEIRNEKWVRQVDLILFSQEKDNLPANFQIQVLTIASDNVE